MKSLRRSFIIVALLAEIVTSFLQSSFLSQTTLDLHFGDTYYVVVGEGGRTDSNSAAERSVAKQLWNRKWVFS
jgi:hypothetical protein